MTPTLLVRDLSEQQILARILPRLSRGPATLLGPGDDCAVVAVTDGRYVVTTDVLVENYHFRREWSTGYDVGWRAAMQNLADVAAMGAEPTAVVVALVLPADLEVAWVDAFADGLSAASCGVGIVGGDLSAGPCIVVSIAAHGDLAGRHAVLRSGARPGNVLAHAGRRGWSAAGLALLESGVPPAGLLRWGAPHRPPPAPQPLPPDPAPLVAAYLRPNPPLDAGPAAARAGATAMIDVSDGLLIDAGRLARASGVVLDVSLAAFDADARLLRAAARAVHARGGRPAGAGDDAAHDPGAGTGPGAAGDPVISDDVVNAVATRWILTGGEDHGLLAAFPPGVPLPAPFHAVGQILAPWKIPGANAGAVLVDGATPPATTAGWDHFRPQPSSA